MNEGCGKPLAQEVWGEITHTCRMEIVPSATLLAVHTDFCYCVISVTIELSAIKRKEILDRLGGWHIPTAQALAGTQCV